MAGRAPPPADSLARSATRSRLVHWLKLLLPATALALAVAVLLWPQFKEEVDLVVPDLEGLSVEETKSLKMINARLTGHDAEGQPYTVTAEVATQARDNPDLVFLDRPQADLVTGAQTWVTVHGSEGVLRRGENLLSLSGTVSLFHDAGYEFHTSAATIDLAGRTAEGGAPVTGQGPFGVIESEGFRILDDGARVVFTGQSHLRMPARGGSGEDRS